MSINNLCQFAIAALADGDVCEQVDEGARVRTHCMYPSFEPVHVYIWRFGEGFVVHDRGEAAARAWSHGREERVANRYLNRTAVRYGLRYEKSRLSVQVEDAGWLRSAILSVANAAAQGCWSAVEHLARSEADALRERINIELVNSFGLKSVGSEVLRVGESGREYRFDFEVRNGDNVALVEAVTPFATSIFSKYTAFSDTNSLYSGGGFAVHDRPLEQTDQTLLSQVANVIPFPMMTAGLEVGLHRYLS